MNKLSKLIACSFLGVSFLGCGALMLKDSKDKTEVAYAAQSKTATYEIKTKNSVSSSGDFPTGSKATYTQTYSQTAGQITSSNSATLILEGYQNTTISSITLSMRSNSKKGAGTFSTKCGDTEIAALSSATNFNNWYDSTSYSTSYKDVHVTLTKSDYIIKENEKITIVINATVNSLYIQKYTISYVDVQTSPLASVSVATNPNKTTYYDGETFDPSGLVLTRTYEDGTSDTIAYEEGDTDFSFSPTLDTKLTVDNKSVTITYNGKTVDLPIEVKAARTITSLDIIETGKTEYFVGETFNAEGLVAKATFNDGSTETYSEELSNLDLLTFIPELGSKISENDKSILFYVTNYGEDVFNGFDITIKAKPYATKISDVKDLWDGQVVYFLNKDGTKVATTHDGENNLDTINATTDTNGLSLNDSAGAQGFTLSREKLDDGVTYYTFYDADNKYYLSDCGARKNNLKKSTTKVDESNNCVYFTIEISSSGEFTIKSKTNTAKPLLEFNSQSSIFSCYESGQQSPVLYAKTVYSETSVAAQFEKDKLHMEDYKDNLGWCKDEEHHYYKDAKAVFNAMSEDEKLSISDAGLARLEAWATANGEKLDSNMNLVSLSKANLIKSLTKNSSSIVFLTLISLISITFISYAYIAHKKQKQN